MDGNNFHSSKYTDVITVSSTIFPILLCSNISLVTSKTDENCCEIIFTSVSTASILERGVKNVIDFCIYDPWFPLGNYNLENLVLHALIVLDQPIAFASKSLTDAESRYANIERELLAIVFACQRFSTYLLGRSFTTERSQVLGDDCHQELSKCSPCLQRMLLQLQRFDITIHYRPEITLNMHVDYVAFSKPWIEKLKGTLQEDPILATVYPLSQQGWPHQRKHVPCIARRYFDLGMSFWQTMVCSLKDSVWSF